MPNSDRLQRAQRARSERIERMARESYLASRRCAGCGGTMPPPAATGRPRRWCSEECRRAAGRASSAPSSTSAGDLGEQLVCLRCGTSFAYAGLGRRRPRWCSATCRRRAAEERRAAEAGAIGLRVVDRVVDRVETVETIVDRVETVERPVDHSLDECVARVLASPGACRRVLQGLAREARAGGVSEAKWAPVAEAAVTLSEELQGTGGIGGVRAPRRRY